MWLLTVLAAGSTATPVKVEDNSYVAAVVEFSPQTAPNHALLSRADALQIINANLDRCEEYIKQAKAAGAQIVVFPEYGVFGFPDQNWERDTILPFLDQVPDPSTAPGPVLPCDQPEAYPLADTTIRASCLAKKYGVVLVFDIGDVVFCNTTSSPTSTVIPHTHGTCRSDGRIQYNTAVAFDEQGRLLVKYHKHHLYGESEWYDVPRVFSKAAFNTSFGVTFGLFICFDVLWELHETLSDFAFPTWWDNENSPLSAVAAQKTWSFLHRANLLAANSGVDNTCSGSGIYTKGKALATFFNPGKTPQEKLLIATLPRLK